jgi:steroid delta-isomerase-like uncharacterized protein
VSAKDTFRSYIDAFNRGDVAALAALYAPETTFRNPFSPAPMTTREAVRAFVAPMFSAYSDVTAMVQDMVADDDRVAARLGIRAIHTGLLSRPSGPVAGTGRRVQMRTAEFLLVDDDGLIVDHERIFDSVVVLAQLGLFGGEGSG